MAEIQSLSAMGDYVLRKLGYPVVNVEMSDDQLFQIIEDSIQDMQRYLYGDATYLDYVPVIFSAGVEEYPLSALRDFRTSALLGDIESSWDLVISFGYDGITTLFSPTNILLQQKWVEQGGYPGGPGSNYDVYGMPMADYQISMQYMEEINKQFGKNYRVKWIDGKKVFKVYPTPMTDMMGTLVVYKRQEAIHLYNHPLMKKLSVARGLIQWGRNLKKYGGQLPDGLTINAQELYQEGKDDEEKIMDKIRAESEPYDFFVE